MDTREAKLRRLNAFRRSLPHISASALSAVLTEVDKSGIPDAHCRSSMKRATALLINEVTPYGPMLVDLPIKLKNGKMSSMLAVQPAAMLTMAVKQGGGFATLLEDRLAAFPSSPERPWRLILYTDEVVPGNALSHDNRRKVWVVYFSFLELGQSILSREDAWFCTVVVRSHFASEASAGISQTMGSVIKMFFGASHSFADAGVVVVMSGSNGNILKVFAKLGMILQDGGAHKHMWHCKNDSGTKLCMLCLNLVSEESELVDEDGSNMLTCTLVQEADLIFASDDAIRGAVKRLAMKVATLSAAECDMWSQAIGFRHEPDGLLLDPDLDDIVKPATHFCHDWMHACMVHGVFHTTGYLVLESLIDAGFKDVWNQLHDYMAMWKWPGRIAGSTLTDVFCSRRAASSRKAHHMKCTASEALSIYQVMSIFVQCIAMKANKAPLACIAYVAMADMLDLLASVPLGVVTPDMLRQHVKKFLDSCLAAGWGDYIHPKYHWLIHLPKHLASFGGLPTCWVHERKHRVVKRYANEIMNTTSFERSVIGEVTAHHMEALKSMETFSEVASLIAARPAPPKTRKLLEAEFAIGGLECLTSREARISPFAICCKGDVVLVQDGRSIVAGRVCFHASYDGEAVSLVSLWTLLHYDPTTAAAEWQVVENPVLLSTGDIRSATISAAARPGVVRVIVPCHLRSSM